MTLEGDDNAPLYISKAAMDCFHGLMKEKARVYLKISRKFQLTFTRDDFIDEAYSLLKEIFWEEYDPHNEEPFRHDVQQKLEKTFQDLIAKEIFYGKMLRDLEQSDGKYAFLGESSVPAPAEANFLLCERALNLAKVATKGPKSRGVVRDYYSSSDSMEVLAARYRMDERKVRKIIVEFRMAFYQEFCKKNFPPSILDCVKEHEMLSLDLQDELMTLTGLDRNEAEIIFYIAKIFEEKSQLPPYSELARLLVSKLHRVVFDDEIFAIMVKVLEKFH